MKLVADILYIHFLVYMPRLLRWVYTLGAYSGLIHLSIKGGDLSTQQMLLEPRYCAKRVVVVVFIACTPYFFVYIVAVLR